MTESDDRFERELAARLRSVADGEPASADLASLARDRLVRARSRHRTRRGVTIGALVAASVASVCVLAVAAVSGPDSANLRTVDDVTTTAAPPPSTTSPAVVPVPERSTTTAPVRPTTTTTTAYYPPPRAGCAIATGEPQPKSEDWARYYRTEPAQDQPARVQICLDRQSVGVGETVTATLIGDDPDAVIVDEECGWEVRWGDTEQPGNLCRDYLSGTDHPEETPKREPGHIERSATHAFSAPGTYTITGVVWSSRYDGRPSPYSSYAEVKITIVVGG